jgi:acetyl-CoA C-acetyltransferase
MAEAYIVAALRTPTGRKGGRLAGWHPADLGALVIDALVARAGADPQLIDDVILGCVSQVGEQSTNIARNAVLASSLPESVPGTSVDRQDLVIAAGVESMTRVPMFSPSALAKKAGLGGYMSPGMRSRYGDTVFSQFTGAEMMAKKYGFDRAALDAYALESHRRAAHATESGAFEAEIVPVPVRDVDGQETADLHRIDEGIRPDASLEAIGAVKLLAEGGVISAANASQISDGASGVLVASEQGLKTLGVAPLARIHQMTVIGHDPVIMLEAPLPATRAALKKAGLGIGDIDCFEVNEAFASVPLAWLRYCDADPARINVNGGAIALGHPLGASGTKLMATLVHALRRGGGRYGLQTMCEGGGMANVTLIERL